ncbi:hypothetical protein [Endozoicomonas sp.]|uniref:hypothetical protein n=1 Tax=Endozoicomonas sp. TaxID=1892382 RepID=UPI00383B8CAB
MVTGSDPATHHSQEINQNTQEPRDAIDNRTNVRPQTNFHSYSVGPASGQGPMSQRGGAERQSEFRQGAYSATSLTSRSGSPIPETTVVSPEKMTISSAETKSLPSKLSFSTNPKNPFKANTYSDNHLPPEDMNPEQLLSAIAVTSQKETPEGFFESGFLLSQLYINTGIKYRAKTTPLEKRIEKFRALMYEKLFKPVFAVHDTALQNKEKPGTPTVSQEMEKMRDKFLQNHDFTFILKEEVTRPHWRTMTCLAWKDWLVKCYKEKFSLNAHDIKKLNDLKSVAPGIRDEDTFIALIKVLKNLFNQGMCRTTDDDGDIHRLTDWVDDLEKKGLRLMEHDETLWNDLKLSCNNWKIKHPTEQLPASSREKQTEIHREANSDTEKTVEHPRAASWVTTVNKKPAEAETKTHSEPLSLTKPTEKTEPLCQTISFSTYPKNSFKNKTYIDPATKKEIRPEAMKPEHFLKEIHHATQLRTTRNYYEAAYLLKQMFENVGGKEAFDNKKIIRINGYEKILYTELFQTVFNKYENAMQSPNRFNMLHKDRLSPVTKLMASFRSTFSRNYDFIFILDSGQRDRWLSMACMAWRDWVVELAYQKIPINCEAINTLCEFKDAAPDVPDPFVFNFLTSALKHIFNYYQNGKTTYDSKISMLADWLDYFIKTNRSKKMQNKDEQFTFRIATKACNNWKKIYEKKQLAGSSGDKQ